MKKKFNKKDLIRFVSRDCGLSQADTDIVLTSIYKFIKEMAKEDCPLVINGVCKGDIRHKKGRKGVSNLCGTSYDYSDTINTTVIITFPQ